MNPNIIYLLAVVLSGVSAMVMFYLNKDILKPPPIEKAEFTSIEFDADDTSYSPAETHSMNQLSKELSALKEKLLDREKELDAREAAISLELDSLEKQKDELSNIRLDLASKLEDFESRRDQDVSEEKLKEYKDTATRWVEMGPEVASIEIQNWRQKRRFEEALGFLKHLSRMRKHPSLLLCITVMKIV